MQSRLEKNSTMYEAFHITTSLLECHHANDNKIVICKQQRATRHPYMYNIYYICDVAKAYYVIENSLRMRYSIIMKYCMYNLDVYYKNLEIENYSTRYEASLILKHNYIPIHINNL